VMSARFRIRPVGHVRDEGAGIEESPRRSFRNFRENLRFVDNCGN
jgi:hypothetical protein